MNAQFSRGYRIVKGLARLVTRVFFKEVVCEGDWRVPDDAGGLIVAWHPNGLVDPALILAHFPKHIVFGARHGLFGWPVVGRLLRSVGTVPIYRAQDVTGLGTRERHEANEKSLDELAGRVASGSFSALFPEGLSHDYPHLSEIKTGAARLYYRAVELTATDRPAPVIIPVGLHYDRKDIFRSRALVWFHRPLKLPQELTVSPSHRIEAARRRELYRGLTSTIESTLVEVARATDDWNLHHLMHRLRKLLRAERASRSGRDPGRPSMAEREKAFAQVWRAYQRGRETHPEEIEALRSQIARYDRDLEALGLEDHELSRDPRLTSPWWIALSILQFVAVFLLFPPILVAGYVLNVIPYFALKGVSRLLTKATKDAATVKIIGGSILFPCSWAAAAFLAARTHHELHLLFPSVPDIPLVAAFTTVVLAIVGGLLALVYNELSGQSWRAIRVRITRRKRREAVSRLRMSRSHIYETVHVLMQEILSPETDDDAGEGTATPPRDT